MQACQVALTNNLKERIIMIRVTTFINTCAGLLLAAALLVAGCSTDSYYRGNTRVTVERFIGIPYLETEETVRRKQPGSDSVPVQ
jgi:hypothetical protein